VVYKARQIKKPNTKVEPGASKGSWRKKARRSTGALIKGEKGGNPLRTARRGGENEKSEIFEEELKGLPVELVHWKAGPKRGN